jgi:hypothetical protein
VISLIRKRLGVDIIRCIDNNQHGTAANLAVIIVFGRHLGFRRNGDFKRLKTGRASDGVGFHLALNYFIFLSRWRLYAQYKKKSPIARKMTPQTWVSFVLWEIITSVAPYLPIPPELK